MKWNETSPEKQTEMEIAGVITFYSHGYWEKIIKIEKRPKMGGKLFPSCL